MSIQLAPSEAFFPGLRRLVLAECQNALDYLRQAQTATERHEAVHEVRKSFKKIRAAIRLVRDAVPFYHETNAFFRDEARKISTVRDATSNLETLDALEKQYASVLKPDAFAPLRQILVAHREELSQEAFDQRQHLQTIQAALEQRMVEIEKWDCAIDTYAQIRPSLRRVYKRGYAGLHRARSSGESEDFHEWRKRAKYLRYQIDILSRIWRQVMEAWEDELHDLTDLTGLDHDLHNLSATLRDRDPAALETPPGLLLPALITQQQQLAKTHALLLGERFYQRDPDAFCDALEVYWDNYRRESERVGLPDRDELPL